MSTEAFSDTEIVDKINRATSLLTINIATTPTSQAQYLSEFAMYVNDLLSLRSGRLGTP